MDSLCICSSNIQLPKIARAGFVIESCPRWVNIIKLIFAELISKRCAILAFIQDLSETVGAFVITSDALEVMAFWCGKSLF